jgi:pyrimidine deaminase RibD-like protein
MIVDHQESDPKRYGMVAAAVVDPSNNIVASTSSNEDGKWTHAERNAINKYNKQYGEIPKGSIIITTLSPCNEDNTKMANERYGESCTDLINDAKIKYVYAGYNDPTQNDHREEFTVDVTSDPEIQLICKKISNTFLKQNESKRLR